MSRPLEPTAPLDSESWRALVKSLEGGASPEEMSRRVERARVRLSESFGNRLSPTPRAERNDVTTTDPAPGTMQDNQIPTDATSESILHDEPPVEQLAQQQTREPVAFASVSETAFATPSGLKFHLVGTATDGSLWERWSDDGQWLEVERPMRK